MEKHRGSVSRSTRRGSASSGGSSIQGLPHSSTPLGTKPARAQKRLRRPVDPLYFLAFARDGADIGFAIPAFYPSS